MCDAIDLLARWVSDDHQLRMMKVRLDSFYGGDYHGLIGIDDSTGEVRVVSVRSGGL